MKFQSTSWFYFLWALTFFSFVSLETAQSAAPEGEKIGFMVKKVWPGWAGEDLEEGDIIWELKGPKKGKTRIKDIETLKKGLKQNINRKVEIYVRDHRTGKWLTLQINHPRGEWRMGIDGIPVKLLPNGKVLPSQFPVPPHQGAPDDQPEKKEEGFLITKVFPNWPFDKTGGEEGDFIWKVNGRKVRNLEEIQTILQNIPGRRVSLTVLDKRSGGFIQLPVNRFPDDWRIGVDGVSSPRPRKSK